MECLLLGYISLWNLKTSSLKLLVKLNNLLQMVSYFLYEWRITVLCKNITVAVFRVLLNSEKVFSQTAIWKKFVTNMLWVLLLYYVEYLVHLKRYSIQTCNVCLHFQCTMVLTRGVLPSFISLLNLQTLLRYFCLSLNVIEVRLFLLQCS